MHRRRAVAVLFIALALAGCASVPAGPEQAPNQLYPQGEPRDISGMH
jgi:hypothetical protein